MYGPEIPAACQTDQSTENTVNHTVYHADDKNNHLQFVNTLKNRLDRFWTDQERFMVYDYRIDQRKFFGRRWYSHNYLFFWWYIWCFGLWHLLWAFVHFIIIRTTSKSTATNNPKHFGVLLVSVIGSGDRFTSSQRQVIWFRHLATVVAFFSVKSSLRGLPNSVCRQLTTLMHVEHM